MADAPEDRFDALLDAMLTKPPLEPADSGSEADDTGQEDA